jgi:hypothetical protein
LNRSLAARLTAGALGAIALASAVGAPAAQAHHSILIREVRPSADPGSVFIELQTYRQGQNDVAGSPVHSFSANGLFRHDFAIPGNVASGVSQRSILIGGPGFPGADFADPGLTLAPAGGAVCFPEAAPPDCVAWGAFTGAAALPFPGAGPPAAAVPEGLSITRTLERSCPTALDEEDDSGKSIADFAITSPTPRSNSAPGDLECVPCGTATATIVGTDGKNVLRGTAGRDVIAGGAGADTIRGLGGPDLLCGGIGKDRLIGGAGRDRMIGGRGRDTCRGGRGKDIARSCEAQAG